MPNFQIMKTLLYLITCLVTFNAFAQNKDVKVLTLDECISTALQNNIQIKRAKNNELIARSNDFQSLMEMLPNINANINYDYFFGTTFDQSAARQVSATTSTSNPNLTANWVLFNGLSRNNTKKQRAQEYLAAEGTTANTRLTTEANILASYLNVVLSQENIEVAKQRVDLLSSQLDREVKRESVGVSNLELVYNFRSQLANERLNLTNLENDFERNRLTLLQAMQLDPTAADYEVETYQVSEEDLLQETTPFLQVLNESLGYNPALRSAEAFRQAARYQFKSAQGQRLPVVSVFGVYGSNYSTNGARNPDRAPGASGNENFEPDATFKEQMGYNLFEFIDFRLTIPIFNRFRTNNSVQTAKLNMANAELTSQQASLDVTNTVQNAYLDLINAQSTYRSASENLEALGQSFDFMEKRFQTGNTDFYTYLESLNNKNRAEVQLTNAKYSIVLRKKILDLFRGTNQ